MDMVLTARMVDAAEAERAGLVSRVVAADQLMSETLAAAATIARVEGLEGHGMQSINEQWNTRARVDTLQPTNHGKRPSFRCDPLRCKRHHHSLWAQDTAGRHDALTLYNA
jgi:enoyl-CoA hydratase/carnithine racemase